MKKILIVTSSIDYTVDYIIDKYKNRVKFYRLNVDKFEEYSLCLRDNGNWIIGNSRWEIDLNDIYSIYYRKPILPSLDEYDVAYHTMIAKDIISMINGIVDSFSGTVLTKPFILRKSENKIYQIKLAYECELIMPNSLLTNSTSKANKFISKYDSIIKPISIGKLTTKDKVKLFQTSVIKKNLEEISLNPVYIQKYEQKYYEVRITIIGNNIYPVKIMPYNKIDWRIDQEKNIYELIDIPKDIKDKCLNLMNKMDIKFGAFDFIVNQNKEFIFLEVNPNGQWLWLEETLDIDISKKIIDYLQGEI